MRRALLVLSIVVREWSVITSNIRAVGAASLVFNLASMLIGYFVGKLMHLTEAQDRAIAFEIGIHNSALAICLALAVLGNGAMAIPAAIYSLLMFVTAAIFGWWVTSREAM